MSPKVLMIDDSVGITKTVELIAGQLGMGFRALNNSVTACEVFIEYRPDIVMLDLIMPQKDGVDVLNEILTTGIPARIVLTSGYGETYLRLAQGVARFHGRTEAMPVLVKPFRRNELIDVLKCLAEQPAPSGITHAAALS